MVLCLCMYLYAMYAAVAGMMARGGIVDVVSVSVMVAIVAKTIRAAFSFFVVLGFSCMPKMACIVCFILCCFYCVLITSKHLFSLLMRVLKSILYCVLYALMFPLMCSICSSGNQSTCWGCICLICVMTGMFLL